MFCLHHLIMSFIEQHISSRIEVFKCKQVFHNLVLTSNTMENMLIRLQTNFKSLFSEIKLLLKYNSSWTEENLLENLLYIVHQLRANATTRQHCDSVSTTILSLGNGNLWQPYQPSDQFYFLSLVLRFGKIF